MPIVQHAYNAAKDQVTNLGISNRVVGHPANSVADSKDRGIGQRLRAIQEQLAVQQQQMTEPGMFALEKFGLLIPNLLWNEGIHQWELPQ